MSAEWLLSPLASADALSVSMLVCAGLFAGVMTAWSRGRSRDVSFMTYFFEGITIVSSAIVLISVFHHRLFEQIGDNKTFLMIVALMTLSYALRDVFARFTRVSADVGHRSANQKDVT